MVKQLLVKKFLVLFQIAKIVPVLFLLTKPSHDPIFFYQIIHGRVCLKIEL